VYAGARKGAGLSIEEAAFQIHIAPRTLVKYEHGESTPGPDVVLAMSRVYKKPWMTQIYCKECCAIGQAYSYEVLNNVNLDPPSIMLKLIGEMKEAQAVLHRMLGLTVNKNSRSDFNEQEWTEFTKCLQEFLDVEHNIETLKIALNNWCDISEEIQKHNKKCLERGYVKKERALCGAI
jgi:transcriptional regulator with XRE-family HTH domain